MQQFTVPQFIDVEDKIIGPITTRQFLIILSGFIFLVIMYAVLDFGAFIFATVITLIVCGMFSFYRINGMPFHFFVLNFVQTSKRPNTRVWNNAHGPLETMIEPGKEIKLIKQRPIAEPKIYNISRLAELSLIVDTQGAYKTKEMHMEDVRPVKVQDMDI